MFRKMGRSLVNDSRNKMYEEITADITVGQCG